jgi:hypothetical protein
MKRRSKHFGGMSEFTSIADTFIFEFGEIATICGSRISSAEVWIKVCNLNFQETNPDFTY